MVHRHARPARLLAAALALSLLAVFAPIGPWRPLAASATVSPPACTTETILEAPYANCKLGYGGASLTLGPATRNEVTGYAEGRFTSILPSKASLCADCTTGSGGLGEQRTYVPGGPTASAGGPTELSFGMWATWSSPAAISSRSSSQPASTDAALGSSADPGCPQRVCRLPSAAPLGRTNTGA